MIRIPEDIINAQFEYIEKVKAYIEGNIEFDEFKHVASPMGVYAQKREGTFMVRPRIFSGMITKEHLKAVGEIAKRYSGGKIHLTTRQDIQFHGLQIKDTIAVFEALTPLGLIGKGAGGNGIRNITNSPLSGVQQGEVFDVTKHAEVATEYILNLKGITELPRKYKIAISNGPEDNALATISDLGFIAKIQNGQRGFEVYGAGGLGGSPDTAIHLESFIPESEMLYHIEAMKRLFEDEGDRTNRNKARIRYIKYRLGEGEFKALYANYLEAVKGEKNLDITLEAEDSGTVQNQNAEAYENSDFRVIPQNSRGCYALYVHPENGDLAVKDLEAVLNVVDEIGDEVEFRLTNTQGLYIRNIEGQHVARYLRVIDSFTKRTDIESSVTCTGAKNCRIGLCNSQGLLKAITDEIEDIDRALLDKMPKVYISGCRNSCGWHHIGALGFSGAVIKDEEGAIPAYHVFLGGHVKAGESKLAKSIGLLPARRIPSFVKRLIESFGHSELQSFSVYIETQESEIINLLNEYKSAAIIDEEIRYLDFESDKIFLSKQV